MHLDGDGLRRDGGGKVVGAADSAVVDATGWQPPPVRSAASGWRRGGVYIRGVGLPVDWQCEYPAFSPESLGLSARGVDRPLDPICGPFNNDN